jgi:hypothetical protein
MPGSQDPMGAVLEGQQYSENIFNARRRTDAYNALKQAYGPAIADDPANAFNAVKANVAQQTAGTQVQQSQEDLRKSKLANSDTANEQQRMAAYRAAAILKGSAGADGTVSPDIYDKLVGQNAGLLGIAPEQVGPLREMLTQPGGAGHLDAFMQGMVGPTKVTGATGYGTDANGNPVAIVRDQYGNIHQQGLGGTTPVQQQRANQGQQNADTNQQKLPIAQQNANANSYRARVYGNNSTYGAGGGAPYGAAAAPNAAPTGAAAPNAPGKPLPSRIDQLPPKGRQQVLGQADQIVNAGSILGTTNQIIDTVANQISPYTAGTGSLLKNMPGSSQADLKANLKTLAAQGLTSWIASLKNQQGQTGIGRVLQSEANAAMTLFGNMEQDQSAKQLSFHLGLFKQTVNRLYQHQQQAFSTMWGVKPHEALGVPDPTAPAPSSGGKGQFQEGLTYTDANGNQATYRGGKFVPVK